MRRQSIVIGHLEPFGGLTEETGEIEAQKYYRADQRISLLKNLVIVPFRDALYKGTGHTDEKRPEEPVTVTYLEGTPHPIKVHVTPTEKRPPTKEVYQDLMFFLDEIERQYKSGIKRPGVLTIDDKSYIQLDLVSSRIAAKKKEVTGVGISREIELPEISDNLLGSVERDVIICLDGRYGRVDHANLLDYTRAARKSDYFKKSVADPFERALKERTGWSKQNVPAESTENFDEVGNHIFRLLTIPSNTIEYNSVIETLVGEKTPSGKIGKSTGDFVRILDGIEDERTAKYETCVRKDKKLVSIQSLRARIAEVVKQQSDRPIRQPIEHYPLICF